MNVSEYLHLSLVSLVLEAAHLEEPLALTNTAAGKTYFPGSYPRSVLHSIECTDGASPCTTDGCKVRQGLQKAQAGIQQLFNNEGWRRSWKIFSLKQGYVVAYTTE